MPTIMRRSADEAPKGNQVLDVNVRGAVLSGNAYHVEIPRWTSG